MNTEGPVVLEGRKEDVVRGRVKKRRNVTIYKNNGTEDKNKRMKEIYIRITISTEIYNRYKTTNGVDIQI